MSHNSTSDAPNVPYNVVPFPSRDNVEAKAVRILIERRLHILSVHHERIYARVRGDEAWYHCGWKAGDWWCHCPNPTRKCSHVLALQYVVTPPSSSPSAPPGSRSAP